MATKNKGIKMITIKSKIICCDCGTNTDLRWCEKMNKFKVIELYILCVECFGIRVSAKPKKEERRGRELSN